MASSYWIKLYQEILHDPKMERLTDHLYRRCIELFLQAGETDQAGDLPTVDDMAWTLRSPCEDILADLKDLEKVGIINYSNGVWSVTNFADRQAPVDNAERVSRFRERKHKAEYYGQPETEAEPEPDIITETVTEPVAISNATCNESLQEVKRNVTHIRLENIRLENIRPETDPALPAASTPPTALNASLSDSNSDSPVPRSSNKPPPLPPTNPPENETLTGPEIAHFVNRTVGFYSEIMHPRAPTQDDMQAIRNMGKLWGYKQVYTAFQESARGSSPYKTIPEIYSHLGDGNGEAA